MMGICWSCLYRDRGDIREAGTLTMLMCQLRLFVEQRRCRNL